MKEKGSKRAFIVDSLLSEFDLSPIRRDVAIIPQLGGLASGAG
jgi:hypothetical protein